MVTIMMMITKGMPAMPSDGWTRYLTPSVALFEYVDDDELLPIRPIGIQVKLCILMLKRMVVLPFRPFKRLGVSLFNVHLVDERVTSLVFCRKSWS